MSMQSITTWTFKPDEPLLLAKHFAHLEGTVLFYSGGNFDSSQSSFLCLFPKEKFSLQACEGCWEDLQDKLGAFKPDGLDIPYWVGYLGYEMGCFADPDKEIPYFKPHVPDCLFYVPSVVIHFDHLSQLATLYSAQQISFELKPPSLKKNRELTQKGYCSDTLQTYLEKIGKIKEWIHEGEVYQVNLSQERHLERKYGSFEIFEKAVRMNPAPFSAYLQCGTFSIVSSSPERFLCKREGTLEARPIKGTIARGKTSEEDKRNREMLLASEKERAELLMITDLMRSDMGKVAAIGSVKTRAMWVCEEYANVFHLLSIIEGKIDHQANPVETVRKLFPSGSVTGCPKLRAMEAIAALEQRPRGIYTGSIGYFAYNGDFDFNVAIRTLIVHPESVQMQLGGAIVIDSDPVAEFEETLHKGHTLLSVLGDT